MMSLSFWLWVSLGLELAAIPVAFLLGVRLRSAVLAAATRYVIDHAPASYLAAHNLVRVPKP